jgi:hypothetical protein
VTEKMLDDIRQMKDHGQGHPRLSESDGRPRVG